MELSIFLAKWFGIYLLIIAALLIVRREQFNHLVRDIFGNPALLSVTGVISLMIGVAIAVSHPIFEFNWRGLITLFGYLAILKGVIRIGFPEAMQDLGTKFAKGNRYWITLGIIVVAGAYLTYSGFTN